MLGIMESYCRQAMHIAGRPIDLEWGGISLIILVGDDYQLPPISYGAFYCLEGTEIDMQTKLSEAGKAIRENGFHEFREFASTVMTLNPAKRVNSDQNEFKQLLNDVRCEIYQDLTSAQKERLLGLHIHDPRFTPKQRQYIIKNSLHVFANKAPRDDFNRKILKSITNSSNPVARIVSTTRSSLKAKIANSHFDEDRIPLVILLAKTARVQITGVNFNPAWGLYHGSIGEVIDIVFDDGGNPNYNSLPLYVLVDFPQYKGPKFLKTHKTWVPIPVHTCRCEHNCCERTYVPLTLAYGKTAHTVQGLTAGPVETRRAENLIKSIVVDPGTKKFEGKCVGLFYTLLGRGTTLGNRSDLTSSAVYFNGVNMSRHRITNLWQSAKGTPFKLVHLRQRWVSLLHSNTRTSGFKILS